MKPLLFSILLSIALLDVTNCVGQEDLNAILESSKGTWIAPISKYKQIQDAEYRKNGYGFGEIDSSVTFICDSAYEVRASYNGKVIYVSGSDGIWSLITKYGDYYIYYGGLAMPNFKLGEDIEKGQVIARITKDQSELQYHFDFVLRRLNEFINPMPWFKK